MKRIATCLVSAALVAGSVVVVPAGPATAAVYKCNGKTATIVGTTGNDVLKGTSGNDVIVGRGGHDSIDGKGGHDTICGNAGNDGIVGGGGNDTIIGGSGHDTIYGGPGADDIYAQSGNDRVIAGSGNDRIWGSTGHDALYAGSGNDRIYGGMQSDVVYGGPGTDRLFGQSGRDILYGGPGTATTYGGTSIDACYEAVEPDGSKCDKDQLNLSGSSNWEPSDLSSNKVEAGGFSTVAWSYPQVNGETYRRGIGCEDTYYIYAEDTCTIEFVLSRKYTRFAARLGHVDTNYNTSAKVRYELLGDGTTITSKTVTYGTSPQIIANVTNVLRLELRITSIDKSGYAYEGDGTHFLWLDPRISARSGLKPAIPE